MEVIAEIGQNHDGDMDRARELIRLAKANGADVAKFQVYDARALFPRENNPWYDYNCRTELSRDDVRRLADECAACGVEFMASVFDVERVAWLEEVGVRRYKLASRSISDGALMSAVAATGKPVLVSLGMWTGQDLPEVPAGAKVEFLHCISKYPTPLAEVGLARVDFTRLAGYSDHTQGITAACAAFARGARVVEKHFTYNTSAYGPDHACSMDAAELAALARFRNELAQVL